MSPEDLAAKGRARSLCEADRATWLAGQSFLAHLALQLEMVPVMDPRVPTAATDGRSVFVNASFILGLSEADRRFVLAHEVWHCALSHIPRREDREALRWNVAIDHEVNALLRNEGMMPPEGCVYFRRWDGLPAEEVYERLPRQGLERGPLADLHEFTWAVTDEGDPDFRPVTEGFAPWPERLRMAAATASMQGGHVPGGAALLIERRGRSALPWREVLGRFVATARATERSWSRPSRRGTALGLHLPGRIRGGPLIAVAVDASGSCITELPRFLTELRAAVAAASGECVRLLVFDAAVHSDSQVYLADIDRVGGLQMSGGGGTDFRPLLERLAPAAAEIDGLVVLTDGFGAAPATPPCFPVLWVLSAHGEPPAPWAICTRLPSEPGRGSLWARVARLVIPVRHIAPLVKH